MTVSERSEKCESFQQHALTVSGKGEEFSAGDDVPDGDGVGRGGGQDLRLRNPFFNADPYSANCLAAPQHV